MATPLSVAVSNSSAFTVFQQEQHSLAQEMQALVAQGATPQQLATWQQQNAARFDAQVQRANQLATTLAAAPMPLVSALQIPAGASPELIDFLTTQADLGNRLVQLHNQDVAAGTSSQITADQNETTLLHQQNGPEMQTQAQQLQVLAAQSAQLPLQAPPPLVIPAGIPAQMQSFLVLRDQLVRGEIALRNQYPATDSTVAEAAVQQWKQQNAAQFVQLQQLAQSLSNSSPIQIKTP